MVHAPYRGTGMVCQLASLRCAHPVPRLPFEDSGDGADTPTDSTRLGNNGPVVRHHVARVSDDHVAQRAVLPPVAHHLAFALSRSAPGWDQSRVRVRAVSIGLHKCCTRALRSASACGRCGWAAGRCCRVEVRVALPLAGRQVQAPQPALGVLKALGARPAETLIP